MPRGPICWWVTDGVVTEWEEREAGGDSHRVRATCRALLHRAPRRGIGRSSSLRRVCRSRRGRRAVGEQALVPVCVHLYTLIPYQGSIAFSGVISLPFLSFAFSCSFFWKVRSHSHPSRVRRTHVMGALASHACLATHALLRRRHRDARRGTRRRRR